MDEAPEEVFNGGRKNVVAGVEVSEQVCLQIPGNSAKKMLLLHGSHVRWETPRGRYDEYSNKFFLRKKPRLSNQ